MKEMTTDQLAKGKKVVMFAVPGAFTPTCSLKHLPGFIEKAEEIKVRSRRGRARARPHRVAPVGRLFTAPRVARLARAPPARAQRAPRAVWRTGSLGAGPPLLRAARV